MFEVKIQSYDDLSETEKDEVSNNGSGKEYACYIRIIQNERTIRLESDAMEPEDASFSRDLSWIKGAIDHAYQAGRNSLLK